MTKSNTKTNDLPGVNSVIGKGPVNPLVNGNKKLSRGIFIFNLPPGQSCPDCTDCIKTCYAMKAYRMYPNVQKAWNRNFMFAQFDITRLQSSIIKQIDNLLASDKIKAVRVHSAGDFFSGEYVKMWASIAMAFPFIKFYAYTKAEKVLDLSHLESLDNFNLIYSKINGVLNYGDSAHIIKLVNDNPGAFICPATEKDSTLQCGTDCSYCLTGSIPVFHIH